MCACSTNQLCCCFSDRPAGVKIIGFLYFVLHFISLIGPIYEINVFRSNVTVYENTTLGDIPFLQNGGYEKLLIIGIIFFLSGIVCSAVLVWATMQVYTSLYSKSVILKEGMRNLGCIFNRNTSVTF